MTIEPKRYWHIKDDKGLLMLLDPEKSYRAYVKYDGSVHLWLYEGDSTLPFDHDAGIEDWGYENHGNYDYYWFVGDLDDVIMRLHMLRAQATQWFIAQDKPVPEPTWVDIVWQEQVHKHVLISHSYSGSHWGVQPPWTSVPFLPTQGVRFFCASPTCHDHAIALQADVALDDDAPYWTFVTCAVCQSRYRVTWKNDHNLVRMVDRIDEDKEDKND